MTRGLMLLLVGMSAVTGALAQQPVSTQEVVPASSPEQLLTPDQMAQAQFSLGVKLMREDQFVGAAQAFERAITTRTNFSQAYNNWGICLVQLGKRVPDPQERLAGFQSAAEKFAKAIELKPDEKLTYVLWSETLVLIGDLPVDGRTRLACYQGAVERCRKAIEIAPDDWDLYNKWAVILATKLADFAVNDHARFQLFTEAAALYGKAAERARFSSEIGPAYANWANALVRAAQVTSDRDLKQSLLRDALKKFERSATAQSSVAGTYAMWGGALISLGKASRLRSDYRDAIDKFNTSLALRPDEPGALYNLACAYALMDNPLMAVQNLKKCFEFDRSKTFREAAERDVDLSLLRGNPGFDELMGLSPNQRGLPTYNPRLSDTPR